VTYSKQHGSLVNNMVDPLKYFAIADARVSPPSNKQLGITLPEKTDYTLLCVHVVEQYRS